MKFYIKYLILICLMSILTYLIKTSYKYIKIIMGIEDKKKLEINAEHFNEFNNFKKPTIICFSAPWCHACSQFRPIWQSFSKNDIEGETDIKHIKNL